MGIPGVPPRSVRSTVASAPPAEDDCRSGNCRGTRPPHLGPPRLGPPRFGPPRFGPRCLRPGRLRVRPLGVSRAGGRGLAARPGLRVPPSRPRLPRPRREQPHLRVTSVRLITLKPITLKRAQPTGWEGRRQRIGRLVPGDPPRCRCAPIDGLRRNPHPRLVSPPQSAPTGRPKSLFFNTMNSDILWQSECKIVPIVVVDRFSGRAERTC
jgi:hypothetical protein